MKIYVSDILVYYNSRMMTIRNMTTLVKQWNTMRLLAHFPRVHRFELRVELWRIPRFFVFSLSIHRRTPRLTALASLLYYSHFTITSHNFSNSRYPVLHLKGAYKTVPLPPCRCQGERSYSSYSFLTSAIEWVSGQRHAPAARYPRESLVPIG
jgi:hypothetical protein